MILMIFIGLVAFCTVAALIYILAYKEFKDQIPYLRLGNLDLGKEFATRLGNWILIFGNFVPISLMVTTEGVRFFQAMIITKDEKLFAHKVNSFTDVQSSNLNEELGQISYVFSDKTGTLTCNEMIFKKLIVAGIPYGNETEQQEVDSGRTNTATKVTNVDFNDSSFLSDLSNPKKM